MAARRGNLLSYGTTLLVEVRISVVVMSWRTCAKFHGTMDIYSGSMRLSVFANAKQMP